MLSVPPWVMLVVVLLLPLLLMMVFLLQLLVLAPELLPALLLPQRMPHAPGVCISHLMLLAVQVLIVAAPGAVRCVGRGWCRRSPAAVIWRVIAAASAKGPLAS